MLVQDLSSNGSMRLNSYMDFGRWTVNSVPWPTVLSTSIEPLPRSIAWRTSDKPNPVPAASRFVYAVKTLKNARLIRLGDADSGVFYRNNRFM